MYKLISIITLLTFSWATLAQAFSFPDDTELLSPTSLCTSAALSLANNGFDPEKSAKAFASVDTLQSMGISMLAAGLTYGALNGLNQIDGVAIPTEVTEVIDIADHAVHQGVAAGVHTVMDLGIHGKADVVAAGLGAVAGTIGGYLSTKIGQWYTNTPNTFEACVAHKAAHFFNGAGQGLIMGLDGNDSEALGKMVAGATGALAAEIYADWAMPTGGTALDGATHPQYSATQIRQTRAAAQFVAGSIAYAMKMNAEQIGVAVVTANVALDHNFAPSALRAAGYLGAEGTEPEEDAEVAEISKSGDKEAKSGGHLGFGENEPASGRMSPTSKVLFDVIETAQREIDQTRAQGQKPGFLQNLALFEAQGAFDERQQNKYLSQSAAELMYKTPGVIKAAPGFIKDTAIGAYDFARDNPGQAAWMAGEYVPGVGGYMTGGHNAKEWHAGDTEWYWAAGETALGFSGFIGKGGKAAVGVVKNSVKISKGGLTLAKTGERTVHGLDLAKHAPKLSTPGGVIRADAIPTGSQLEYLAPGRVRFDGVEFRAVRDLSHMSADDLIRMSKTGVAPRDINGLPIEGHHHLQRYHREPGAFVVEIPEPNHCISNSIQHPLGNSGGLSAAERADWTKLRRAFYKERAKTELLKRGVLNG